MIRKLLSLLLVIIMAAALFPTSVLAKTNKDDSSKEDPIMDFETEPDLGQEDSPVMIPIPDPAGDGIEAEPVLPLDDKGIMKPDVTVANAANDLGNFMTYTFSSFAGYEGDGYNYVQSTNGGTANSTATLTSEQIYMTSGTWLRFYYWYETEANYDKFTFSYTDSNGETVVLDHLSGNSGGGDSPAWVKYVFNCPAAGNYTFTWKYEKDVSNDTGADCVRISKVLYLGNFYDSLDRYAISQNGYTGSITRVSSYGGFSFELKETSDSSHPKYVYSGNTGHASSTSGLQATVIVPYVGGTNASSTVAFDYAYSTEANYDKFNFYVDDVKQFTYSGTNDYSWHTYTFTLEGAGRHVLKWEYVKDGSTDDGNDVVCISNLWTESDAVGVDREYYYYAFLTSTSSSTALYYNTPMGYESFVPVCATSGEDIWIGANNRCVANTDAAIETMVNMDAGETLSFQYYVSSESSYDRLEFYVNGSRVTYFSGWNNPSWSTYTYTAPSRNCYTFRWVYHKDTSIDRGRDIAWIDNIKYTGTFHDSYTLGDALNAMDSDQELVFDTNTYYGGTGRFMPVYGEIGSAVSRNKYWENTEADLYVYSFYMNPGDSLSFDYKVDAESYDKLTVRILCNNSVPEEFTVNGSTGASWTRHTFTAMDPGWYAADFSFEKDGTENVGADCAMVRDFAVTHYDDHTLDDVLNEYFQSGLHFTTGNNYSAFKTCYHPDEDWIAFAGNGNSVQDDSELAYMETETYLMAGKQLKFWYKSDLLPEGEFRFLVNGEEAFVFDDNGSQNDQEWHSYTYTAYTAGRYEFRWEYARPNYSGSAPHDYLYIDDVGIVGSALAVNPLDEALNVEGGTLHFTTPSGTTSFISDWWYDDDIATAGNCMQNTSNSDVQTTVQMNAGDTLRFQYFVDCEYSSTNSYDFFSFLVNGNIDFRISGTVMWEWYEWTAPSAGTYTFKWEYHKDGSVTEGMDCAKLDFVEVIRSSGGLLGDVNSDGRVDANDALLLMRYALGLVPASSLDLTVADYNQNGTTDANDALLIMRHALGLC